MSRLKPVDPSTATGKVKELHDSEKGKLVMVPNMIQVMAISPVALEAYVGSLHQRQKSYANGEVLRPVPTIGLRTPRARFDEYLGLFSPVEIEIGKHKPTSQYSAVSSCYFEGHVVLGSPIFTVYAITNLIGPVALPLRLTR